MKVGYSPIFFTKTCLRRLPLNCRRRIAPRPRSCGVRNADRGMEQALSPVRSVSAESCVAESVNNVAWMNSYTLEPVGLQAKR